MGMVKKALGLAGAGVLGIASMAGVAVKENPTVKQEVAAQVDKHAPAVIEKGKELTSTDEENRLRKLQQQYDQAKKECHDEVGMNPKYKDVDLNNEDDVYEAEVMCLISDKELDGILDEIAKNDDELKAILPDVRKKIGQAN